MLNNVIFFMATFVSKSQSTSPKSQSTSPTPAAAGSVPWFPAIFLDTVSEYVQVCSQLNLELLQIF